MHGSIMMFLVTVPLMEALANFLLPVLLGARELPFPRMTAFGFWTFLFGGLFFYSSFRVGQVPEVGWTAYVPLSGKVFSPDLGVDFWLLGLSVAEVAAIGAGIELTIAMLKMRAPGMTLSRMPIYAWSILVTGFMMLFGFTPLLVATTLLELDRKHGTLFFDPDAGGDPLLWQHLFWIFGHPDVYIQFIPAAGIISMIVPTFARRPLVGHTLVAMAMVATGFLSFGLWVHHMFTAGLPLLAMASSPRRAWRSPSRAASRWLPGSPRSGSAGPSSRRRCCSRWLHRHVCGRRCDRRDASRPCRSTGRSTTPTSSWRTSTTCWSAAWSFRSSPPFTTGCPADDRPDAQRAAGTLERSGCVRRLQRDVLPDAHHGAARDAAALRDLPAGLGLGRAEPAVDAGEFVLGLGVLVFVVNATWNLLLGRGREPARNPWSAGTLDWATELPPPDEGYRRIPIV